jgi:hypothetical protein
MRTNAQMRFDHEEDEMTDKLRQAAEMALEALKDAAFCVQNNYEPQGMGHDWDQQIEALSQALAESEQKPTAYMGTDIDGNPNKFRLNPFGGAIALYTKE